jgi:hypothetical protein
MALILAADLATAQPVPISGLPFPLASNSGVLTQHNDNHRTGANLAETVLNINNVNVPNLKRMFVLNVTGQIVAQPLYLQNIRTSDKSLHNILYVATAANYVYAFDADNEQLIRSRMLHPLIECRPKDQPKYTRNPAYKDCGCGDPKQNRQRRR